MKIFLDSSDIKEIKPINQTGLIDGITTNPSLLSKQEGNFKQILKAIATEVKGPISAEVTAIHASKMIDEAKILQKIAKNIVIKIPLTLDGLTACNYLSKKKFKVNVTLCFSANQAMLAAKAGATYISPFIGRLDDIGENGLQLIKDIKTVYQNYNCTTKILAASIRTPEHVFEVAKIGADVATIPPKIFHTLYKHDLTDKGLESFLSDWKKSGKQIN
ncbi:MAG: fructose-6-phosphate aldolase [Pelagibacteraceae bacterium]|jgi:transaldolase